MKRIIIRNLITFVICGLILTSISASAATIQSSNVEYITNKSVEDAVDELYMINNKTENSINPLHISNGYEYYYRYRYWNNSFYGYTYGKDSLGSPYYKSRNELASAYSSFNNRPYYIKSLAYYRYFDNYQNTIGHIVCLYYNNNDFCMNSNYGSGLSTTAKQEKLRSEMALLLKTNNVTCSTSGSNVTCNVGNFYCKIDGTNSVCGSSNSYCMLDTNGTASCKNV